MKRRDFLQMLGVGGIAIVTPAPLFGSTEQATPKLWTPGQKKDLAGGHVVLTRPRSPAPLRVPPGDTPFALYDRAKVGKVASSRHGAWPIVRGDVFLGASDLMNEVHGAPRRHQIRFREQRVKGEPFTLRVVDEYTGRRAAVDLIEVPLAPGDDGNLAFYRAAMQMREAIRKESVKMFDCVPEPLRLETQIVTIVDNPIYAGARQHGDGFTVETDYTQYVINGDIDPNGWDVYSELGEFPIDVPSEIDMGILLRIDSDVFNGKLKLPRGTGRLNA